MINIKKSEVSGSIQAPSSKSLTHRALILGSLASGESRITSPLLSNDTNTTVKVLQKLNIDICTNGNTWLVRGGTLKPSFNNLHCKNSGTTMRFMTALCSMIEGNSILTADSQLSHRPMLHLLDGLKQVGVKIESKNGYPPIKIFGTGRIQGGVIEIPGNISSQYVSAILLISPLAQKQISLRLTTPLESKPYVKMTMNIMSQFGYCPRSSDDMKEYCTPLGQYNPANITIEGDWSSAAFILAAGVLSGEITVKNLSPASNQADKLILEILTKMNANISYTKNEVTAWKSSLSPLNYDLSDCPDLFPIVAALCSQAEGTSALSGLRRLRIKESDRVKAMMLGLNRMGTNIKVCEDTVKIIGGDLKGAKIDTYNDHRIAMAFAVLSSVAKGKTIIKNSECVSKSYPNFWDDMITIGLDAKEEIK